MDEASKADGKRTFATLPLNLPSPGKSCQLNPHTGLTRGEGVRHKHRPAQGHLQQAGEGGGEEEDWYLCQGDRFPGRPLIKVGFTSQLMPPHAGDWESNEGVFSKVSRVD